jgi:hypothetical protein
MTMVMLETGEGGWAGRKLTTIAAKWDARGRKEASGWPVHLWINTTNNAGLFPSRQP